MPNLFNNDFQEFLELLQKHDLNYLLVGGYAVILHGFVRSTGDMDLWIQKNPENYSKLKKVYFDFGAPIFSLEEFISEQFDVWGIGVEPVKIEILTHLDGIHFEKSFKNCVWLDLENCKVPYINFENLIKNKLASNRFKDLADVEQLNKKNKK